VRRCAGGTSPGKETFSRGACVDTLSPPAADLAGDVVLLSTRGGVEAWTSPAPPFFGEKERKTRFMPDAADIGRAGEIARRLDFSLSGTRVSRLRPRRMVQRRSRALPK
jgi:hypothetical protein